MHVRKMYVSSLKVYHKRFQANSNILMNSRKCHFKNEKIVQGDTVYVRCGNDENLSAGEESWKLGKVSHEHQNYYFSLN